MTAEEFMQAAEKSGYGGKDAAKEYIARSGKTEFTADDCIALYRICTAGINSRKSEKWRDYQGVTCTKHLTNIGADKYD